jgi:hypothetical protein
MAVPAVPGPEASVARAAPADRVREAAPAGNCAWRYQAGSQSASPAARSALSGALSARRVRDYLFISLFRLQET